MVKCKVEVEAEINEYLRNLKFKCGYDLLRNITQLKVAHIRKYKTNGKLIHGTSQGV